MIRPPTMAPLAVVVLALTCACSYTGDALKAPAGQSATTVTATPTSKTPTSSSPPVDTRAEDVAVEPSGTANAGSVTFCDIASLKDKACTKPVTHLEGSGFGCATRVTAGRSMTLRILKDGVEVFKDTGSPAEPGKDGKVAASGELRIDPASLPAGIYSCEFSVDGGKAVAGSLKVKGPEGKGGVSQIRFCPEVSDKNLRTKTAACSTGSATVVVKPKTNLQCSAVLSGMQGQRVLVRIRKGDRNFDFPFSAEQVDKNLGVVTAGVTLNGDADVRCEVHKNGTRVAVRDFTLAFDRG